MEQIVDLLKLQEKTQKSLADYLNITPQAINNYVKGKTEPDIKTLIRIADFFDVSLDYLCNRPFNNNIGFIPEEKKETIKKILKLTPNDFEKIKGYADALKDVK